MPITRIGTLVPSIPSTVIQSPTPTPTAWAKDASTTAPSWAEDRSQVPVTTSGADIAGGSGVMALSSTGDFTAPCSSVAGAAWYGWPVSLIPATWRSSLVLVPFWK